MMIVTATRMSGICTLILMKKNYFCTCCMPSHSFPILIHSFYVPHEVDKFEVFRRLSPHNAKALYFFYIFNLSMTVKCTDN